VKMLLFCLLVLGGCTIPNDELKEQRVYRAWGEIKQMFLDVCGAETPKERELCSDKISQCAKFRSRANWRVCILKLKRVRLK